ncbi:MAG TPA: tRNA-uridine aminocarboxypropyltransferase [Cellvibrionaceae bacterium]
MLVSLLTHCREMQKSTNTGQLVLDSLCGLTGNDMPQVRRVIWQRQRADALLLKHIQQYRSALVYPAAEQESDKAAHLQHYIIIDATWQQAQKMLNQSPYLFHLPRVSLAAEKSAYQLRRNQRSQGLCTSETVAQLMRIHGQTELAQRLNSALDQLQEGREPAGQTQAVTRERLTDWRQRF